MDWDMLKEYLPFIIPLVSVQLALAVTALVHVLRHPNYRFGNRVMWVLIVLFVNFIGPVVYFAFGKGDE
jgi:hypothetical protein